MQRSLESLTSQVFDLAIIGGGITGCCIARDAARRGMSVALVERADFSSGTSAATSKMVHGGLRYLQNLEIGVVRESLLERRAWQVVAPHLVRPLTFLLPTHSRIEDLKYRFALAAYDALSWDRNRLPLATQHLRPTRHLSARELVDLEPVLAEAHLRGGMRYDDCHAFSPERVALECLMDASAHGACVLNHVEAVSLADGTPQRLAVRDCLTSDRVTIEARHVINAAGPWSDVVAAGIGVGAPTRLLRSRGIHVVTRAITRRDALTVPVLGRHFFVIPWRDHSLIGTTDSPYEGSPDDVGVSESDLDDFLRVINAGLPAARLTRDDVLWSYAGLRPLIRQKRGTSYQASRRADIVLERPGLLSVIGGKWTTSRAVAERCVDLIVHAQGASVRPCDTDTTLLPGATLVTDLVPETGLDRRATEETVRYQGALATRVLELARSSPDMGSLIAGRTFAAAVVIAVRDEMAGTLGDVIFRRTGLATLGALPRADLERTCALMSAPLGWSADRISKEIADVEAHYRRVSMRPA
ncbi:MAG: glycerol-3-phosphate dehydrogenase/oxidase [Cytophagaceae bacterium]|nr:glycerol-3-phosphate dehydrogenase/oxidase [Gemmatimonadaceae bacterium]